MALILRGTAFADQLERLQHLFSARATPGADGQVSVPTMHGSIARIVREQYNCSEMSVVFAKPLWTNAIRSALLVPTKALGSSLSRFPVARFALTTEEQS